MILENFLQLELEDREKVANDQKLALELQTKREKELIEKGKNELNDRKLALELKEQELAMKEQELIEKQEKLVKLILL